MKSYYIRSQEGFCIVKLPDYPYVDSVLHHMAIDEAEERGICPGGTKIVYGVVEQDESWYNKFFTEDEAKMFKVNLISGHGVGAPSGIR